MIRAALEDEEDATPLGFVGSKRMSDGIDAVLASIREALNLPLSDFRRAPSPEAAFALLRLAAENSGVFVLLIGNLGSHHTAINLELFRGFALSDDLAPLVVINDADSRAAWSFTLVHELTHLWLGQTGVSGGRAEAGIERFCNDVAGEFLLPAEELRELALDRAAGLQAAEVQISEFARQLNLSSSLVAYRLRQAGVIDQRTWTSLSRSFREHWLRQRAERRRQSRVEKGGPSFYVVRRHRVGRALLHFAARMLAAGALTTTKAGKVLGVKPKQVQALLGSREPTVER